MPTSGTDKGLVTVVRISAVDAPHARHDEHAARPSGGATSMPPGLPAARRACRPAFRRRDTAAGLPGGATSARRASVLALMIIVPVVLLAVFATVQAALVFHAQSIVEAAAQDGLRAAQAYNGSQGDGMAAATLLLDQAGGNGLITGRSVQVDRGPAVARVEVRGQVVTLVPGWSRAVSGIAEGPVERFVGEADR